MSRQFVIILRAVVAFTFLIGISVYFYPAAALSQYQEASRSGHALKDSLKDFLLPTPPPSVPERRAYATFLATRNDTSGEDAYFTAVRVLNYQLQYAPETRTNLQIPFVVLVAAYVSDEKRATLVAEGATVIAVDLLEPEGTNWAHPSEKRFIDQFTNLRLFSLTQYTQILYLDADMLLQRRLDDIWDEPIARQIQQTLPSSARPDIHGLDALLPSNYSLVGVSDTQGAEHPFPPKPTKELNGGFFLLRPNIDIFNYYVSLLRVPNLFDSSLMEQALLNYAHDFDSRMPWKAFEPGKWNVNWPRWKDVVGGAATLHDKFWSPKNEKWIERKLVEKWWRVQGQMEGYWQKHNRED